MCYHILCRITILDSLALLDAAQLCSDAIHPLSSRVCHYQQRLTSPKATTRRWAQVQTAFRGHRVDKTIRAIQLARAALLDARMMRLRLDFSSILARQETITQSVAAIESGIGGMSSQIASMSDEMASLGRGGGDDDNNVIVRNTISGGGVTEEQMERLTDKVAQLTFEASHVRVAVTQLLQQ